MGTLLFSSQLTNGPTLGGQFGAILLGVNQLPTGVVNQLIAIITSGQPEFPFIP